jgi:hypothetical protein
MIIGLKSNLVANAIPLLIFLSFPGYLEYRAVQELRAQLATTKRTRKIRGHVLWAVGLVLFYGLLMLLVVISILGIRELSWVSPFVPTTIGLLLVGMLLGNQQIGKIRKKRLSCTPTNDPPNH